MWKERKGINRPYKGFKLVGYLDSVQIELRDQKGSAYFKSIEKAKERIDEVTSGTQYVQIVKPRKVRQPKKVEPMEVKPLKPKSEHRHIELE